MRQIGGKEKEEQEEEGGRRRRLKIMRAGRKRGEGDGGA